MVLCEQVVDPTIPDTTKELREELPESDHRAATASFIACGACPAPVACAYDGGCKLGNPTGIR